MADVQQSEAAKIAIEWFDSQISKTMLEVDDLFSKYKYRVVTMKLPDKTITFFAYPGLCIWGPAFSCNETKGFIQAVDDVLMKGRSPRR